MENKKNKQVPTPSIRKAAKSNKVGKKTGKKKKIFFSILKVTLEKSRIRIRIHDAGTYAAAQ